ncbi:hypothetical protein [Mycolicibacterium brisbanense]|uniref:Ferredoxin-sulfite/nitrite reductase n=1 Tax=Mycolicibacterium brisbanense TaxID=146020 RepID=A0A100W0J4_9MYCO|nr:hypothetical protein [Mycolicibacterium brisbanense]MCV7161864.1 hypothetical protein [Mycolicibacterium brisbanense]GAS89377.1 ferredoxin-sulfite/nitrite reductase [Mycolicibacterium brisbanense]
MGYVPTAADLRYETPAPPLDLNIETEWSCKSDGPGVPCLHSLVIRGRSDGSTTTLDDLHAELSSITAQLAEQNPDYCNDYLWFELKVTTAGEIESVG